MIAMSDKLIASGTNYNSEFPYPVGDYVFDANKHAGRFLSRRSSFMWAISRWIQEDIHVELLGEYPALQTVKVTQGEKTVMLPRQVSGRPEGVSVSAEEADIRTLNAQIEPYENNTVFDRGLLWVSAFEGRLSSVQVTLLPEHGLEAEELGVRLDEVFAKGEQFLCSIVAGEVNPPYASDNLANELI